jgi:hypothetical protein
MLIMTQSIVDRWQCHMGAALMAATAATANLTESDT